MIYQLLILLAIKHFIVDFLLQGPFQYLNKGKYGHPGGLLHSCLHGIATFAILIIFFHWQIAITLSMLDGVTHYHIDWAKVNMNQKFGWTATTSEYFWWLVGFDQLLHLLTYIGIIYLAQTYGT